MDKREGQEGEKQGGDVAQPSVTQAEAELMPVGDSIEALTGELNVLKREVQQMLWKRKLETPRAVAALKSAGWTVSKFNVLSCTRVQRTLYIVVQR